MKHALATAFHFHVNLAYVAAVGAVIGAVAVPCLVSLYQASVDDASAVAAAGIAVMFGSIKGFQAIVAHLVAQPIPRAPHRDPSLERMIAPVAVAAVLLMLLSFVAAGLAVSAVTYSRVGIDVRWAYQLALFWLRGVGLIGGFIALFAALYIPSLLARRHWGKVVEEIHAIWRGVGFELHDTIGGPRGAAPGSRQVGDATTSSMLHT